MTTVRRFVAAMPMTRRLAVEADPQFLALIDAELARLLDLPQRGPRGGRYETFGPVEYLGHAAIGDDWMHGTMTRVARRQGRYVRPKR